MVLVGAFVAYQAQPQQPDPVAASVAAAYHSDALLKAAMADGSGTALTTHPAASGQRGTATPAAKPQPSASANLASTPAPKPAASPSPAASHQSSSAELLSAVQTDIANGNDLLAVAQYLAANGYSDAAAAGVASCVDGESGGNPESVGSGGGGLIGWTPISSAAPNPNIITGDAAQDMMTQLSDLLYYNSTEIGQSLVTELDGISDPVAAADFYSQNFEKPAVTDSDVVPSVAEQVFSELGG